MAYISLEGSIRTCKVDTAWAQRLESDRFLNPNLMVCPPWNGLDTSGRLACPDSYYTKTAGCNSASDRVTVENELRPKYMEYVNLNASGIQGGQQCGNNQSYPDVVCRQNVLNNTHQQTGQFGVNSGFGAEIRANCVTCPANVAQRDNYRNTQRRRR